MDRKNINQLEEGLNILRSARIHLGLASNNFNDRGKLVFHDQTELHSYTEKINALNRRRRRRANYQSAAAFNGMMLLSEASQVVMSWFRKNVDNTLFKELYKLLENELPRPDLDKLIKNFRTSYNLQTREQEEENGESEYLIRELLVVWLNNNNPALQDFSLLFRDTPLHKRTSYQQVIEILERLLYRWQLPHWKDSGNLFKLLHKPAQLFPTSIPDQIEYIIHNWGWMLGDFLKKLLLARDLFQEEAKMGLPGPGPTQIYHFGDLEEYRRFSEDSAWMPRLVLIAKSTYVWLDQLSKKYDFAVRRLDEIPDAELELLASRGFTGIWLIGIWERSKTSRKIKHIMGDGEAMASAYSLIDYRVSAELGGEAAMDNLQRRAWRYGLRIACDMVPNHTGLDSDWIVEHPDWFLQSDHPPYPSYSFQGQNLSERPEVDIYLEDHYYNRSDAAVVFKLHEHWNHRTRYIYHGNDGTGMPWNDTAQLNFLLPEMREAIIQKILSIALRFPIIRFDAAMTLAKRHIQRLWFPPPGQGGDIPSRSRYSLDNEEFNKLIPQEFWREVVDRVATEAPDTLLLAEAFWMMEGYFVRTLGMHRVYNSAFMNMLKNEENAKYRQSIFNIIEFDPEILKRFVNFMSNPDEDTAIVQFGNDDKYFGVCIMMVTMPGLPMFGHGQIEGFQERYGMEFAKARWQEKEDYPLVQRHEREVFPLLRKRYLFSEVEHFLLFDFFTENGQLNENVFAYTNQYQDQYSLVIYHNKYEHTRGWIREANAVSTKDDTRKWVRISLGETLQLPKASKFYLIFREVISGLEYIRNCAEIWQHGLFQDLEAFKYAVLIDFITVQDPDGTYQKLAEYLQGGGVENLETARQRLQMSPLIDKFSSLCTREIMTLLTVDFCKDPLEYNARFRQEMLIRIKDLLESFQELTGIVITVEKISLNMVDDIAKAYRIPLSTETPLNKTILIFYLLIRNIWDLESTRRQPQAVIDFLEKYFLLDPMMERINLIAPEISREDLKLLLHICHLFPDFRQVKKNPAALLQNNTVKQLLRVNTFDDITWFNRENFLLLFHLLPKVNEISLLDTAPVTEKKIAGVIKEIEDFYSRIIHHGEQSAYKFDILVSKLNKYFAPKEK
ncbi:MAG: hypothetical protein JXB60_03260 [Candidatus Cloacimonetes bacterium]|nr:hypothetical protein [Candidatus Cloacimonadota bacterium]